MKYLVIENVTNAVYKTEFNTGDVIENKSEAERYYIEKYIGSSGTANLIAVNKLTNDEYLLSNGSLNSALYEAERIIKLGNKDFVFEKWADREIRLLEWFKGKLDK